MATIEIAHAETKKGIVIDFGPVCPSVESVVRTAALFASRPDPERRMICSPGWWAGLVCAASHEWNGSPEVLRVYRRDDAAHYRLIVERGRMLELHPQWPVLWDPRGRPLDDLRPENVLGEGPTDADLKTYSLTLGGTEVLEVADLRRAFDQGLLQFGRRQTADGRWLVDAAV